MSQALTGSDGRPLAVDPKTRLSRASGRLLVRHQVAAGLGTAADFATMIALVELLGLSPPTATVFSAIAGGVANFGLSRGWAFRRAHEGSVGSQGLRYALVSFGGAQANAGLLALVLHATLFPYPAARAAVAVVVSLLYTYPLHTRFVFRVRS